MMHPRSFSMALLCAPLVALAAGMHSDSGFYRAAAQGGMAEVEAGQLAQQKSSDQKIRDFAAMMVKDHSAANEELKSLAATEKVTLPAGPSARQKVSQARLEALSGESFDKAYVKDQIKGHRQMLALMEKEMASGQDAAAKAFARKTLPTVRAHLQAIDALSHEETTAAR